MTGSKAIGPAAIYGTEPDAELLSGISAQAARHGAKFALAATAFWYLAWFILPVGIPAWAGLIIFPVLLVVGFGFARTMLLRQVAEEFRRRKELVAVAAKRKAQINTNT